MSTKLNQTTRQAILHALLERKFKDTKQALEKEHKDLALAFYEEKFPPKMVAEMEALPEGFLPTVESVTGRIGGEFVQLNFGQGVRRRVPYQNYRHGSANIVNASVRDPLGARYCKWRNAKDAMEAECRALTAQINAVLGSATTVESLVKKWPEIKPVVDIVLGQPRVTAIVPQLSALNQALGLEKAS